MASRAISGLALGLMTAGGVILWSGIKGEKIGTTVKALAKGQIPESEDAEFAAASVNVKSTSTTTANGSGTKGTPATATGLAIATDAQTYTGTPYLYGGFHSKGAWDCSAFVNYVLGHDFGFTLPGGIKGYNGTSHGPVAAAYLLWSQAKTVKGPPAAGDLCVWQTHIGIAVDGTHMVSALDPQYGTALTPIAGFGPRGEVLVFRRIK